MESAFDDAYINGLGSVKENINNLNARVVNLEKLAEEYKNILDESFSIESDDKSDEFVIIKDTKVEPLVEPKGNQDLPLEESLTSQIDTAIADLKAHVASVIDDVNDTIYENAMDAEKRIDVIEAKADDAQNSIKEIKNGLRKFTDLNNEINDIIDDRLVKVELEIGKWTNDTGVIEELRKRSDEVQTLGKVLVAGLGKVLKAVKENKEDADERIVTLNAGLYNLRTELHEKLPVASSLSNSEFETKARNDIGNLLDGLMKINSELTLLNDKCEALDIAFDASQDGAQIEADRMNSLSEDIKSMSNALAKLIMEHKTLSTLATTTSNTVIEHDKEIKANITIRKLVKECVEKLIKEFDVIKARVDGVENFAETCFKNREREYDELVAKTNAQDERINKLETKLAELSANSANKPVEQENSTVTIKALMPPSHYIFRVIVGGGKHIYPDSCDLIAQYNNTHLYEITLQLEQNSLFQLKARTINSDWVNVNDDIQSYIYN
nr:putative surface protein [Faustovirus mariensis]